MRGFRDIRARTKDRFYPAVIKELIVLLRDNAATNHDDIIRTSILERLHQFWRERLMPRRLRADPDHMHIIVDCILCGLGRGLEQWPNVYVKANIRKRCCDHFRTAIMAVLTHLYDQHARAATLFLGKVFNTCLNSGKACIAFISRAINTREGLYLGAVTPECFFHSHTDFSYSGPCARRLNGGFQQVATFMRTAGHFVQGGLTDRIITRGFRGLQPLDLRQAHGLVVDIQNINRIFVVLAVFVHADNNFGAAVDARLPFCGGFFDPQFGHAGCDRFGHAAQFFDLFDQSPSSLGQFMGHVFNVVRPCQWIDDIRDAGFFLQNQLRITGNAGTEFGGQGNRFVQCVGVQRLCTAQDGAHRFIGGADDVVVRVLFLQRHARGLAMGAQHG